METLTRFRTFLKESWIEVRDKVTWPTREEVSGTTLVVVVTTAAFAVYLGVIDTAMAVLVKRVFDRFA